VLIITSAAYVPAELASELGQLPPSFLPLGNRRLYSRQLATIAALRERVVMSLPDDFVLEPRDAEALATAGITVERTPPDKLLVESLLLVLAAHSPTSGECLRILHGDTLQGDLPLETADVVVVAANDGYYPRAQVQSTAERFISADYRYCQPGDPVLTGYMSFGDAELFQTVLAQETDYIAVLNRYQALSSKGLAVYWTRSWADCGHVNAYYRSRASHTTERVFNELRVERHYIRKRSENSLKIRAELEWFRSLPAAMRHYAPQIGSSGTEPADTFYDIEYLYALPLSDLYVFGLLPPQDWGTIFIRCLEFLSECSAYTAPAATRADWREMYLPKTLRRLAEFADQSAWLLDAPTTVNGVIHSSVLRIAADAQAVLDAAPADALTLCHGDFCFSNILYDARARRIKVIDPRGLGPNGMLNHHGDLRYDFGKLFHSVIGGYDFVIAGQIRAEPLSSNAIQVRGSLPVHTQPIIERFRQTCMAAVGEAGGERLIAAIAVHLFLSMLPLHQDAPLRQLALLSRAVSLHEQYHLGQP